MSNIPTKTIKLADLSTIKGQASAPVQTVSIPSQTQLEIDHELLKAGHVQHPDPKVKVESVPVADLDYYKINEDEFLQDVSLVARSIALDECYKIKTHQKHMAFRWVEFKAHNGYYHSKAMAMGFLNAKPEDVVEHRGEVKEGKIFIGDVVLMKIPKPIYAGMIKGNMLKSIGMVSNRNAVKQAIAKAGPVVTQGRQPNYERDKVEFFEPKGKDLKFISQDGVREEGDIMPVQSPADQVYETLK